MNIQYIIEFGININQKDIYIKPHKMHFSSGNDIAKYLIELIDFK